MLCVLNYESKIDVDVIAYNLRTVSDLEKENLFLLCENPDLRIPVFSDVTFHHSPEDQNP